jgi:hypothetical protein
VPGDRAMRYNPGNIPPGDKSADPPCVWMNQMLGDFDIGSFNVNMTQNVYVSLDGTNLRIRKTKNRVLPRRAMYDEELKTNTFSFVESKVFNIYGMASEMALRNSRNFYKRILQNNCTFRSHLFLNNYYYPYYTTVIMGFFTHY